MSATINFRLDDDLKEELMNLSTDRDIKISVLLREIIEEYLLNYFAECNRFEEDSKFIVELISNNEIDLADIHIKNNL